MITQSTEDAATLVQKYTYATIGSPTERGGVVVSGQRERSEEGIYVREHKLACVGDLVRYDDGSESLIVSGAGYGDTLNDKPLALVGSHVANGDRIIASLQTGVELIIEAGSEPIPGLLDPGFMPVRTVGHA